MGPILRTMRGGPSLNRLRRPRAMPNDSLHAPPTAVLESTVLGGRVRLSQAKDGYRAGMDAALLAAALDAKPGMRALDAGCGVGGALLQAATRSPGACFVGVERDPEALDLARRNIGFNGLQDRVEVLAGDVAQPFRALAQPPFDLAFANPPFFDDPTALRGPAPARRGAWLADDGLQAWTRFLLKAVNPRGVIVVIHRADRLGDLLALLGEGAGSFRIRPVNPYADEPAKRIVVRAVKTGKAPLVLLPPLVMHQRSGAGHTPEADAILRGEAALSWGLGCG
jgi:tRNA1(Val) A37 N6-methylase TrmN6